MSKTGRTPGDEGRFDGFDVLSQADTWDDPTTSVVLERLLPPPALRFFTSDEERIARPFLDRLLGQDEEPRIPVLEVIDRRLMEGEGDGWRHEALPEDGDAWRWSLRLLDETARRRHERGFDELAPEEQGELIEVLRTSDMPDGMPHRWLWSLWTRYALGAFYAHPWAWNEMGFGGPAYPRGYKNLGLDGREPWERPERDAHDPVPWADRVGEAGRR